jgi:hypothetical protein
MLRISRLPKPSGNRSPRSKLRAIRYSNTWKTSRGVTAHFRYSASPWKTPLCRAASRPPCRRLPLEFAPQAGRCLRPAYRKLQTLRRCRRVWLHGIGYTRHPWRGGARPRAALLLRPARARLRGRAATHRAGVWPSVIPHAPSPARALYFCGNHLWQSPRRPPGRAAPSTPRFAGPPHPPNPSAPCA